MLRRMPAPRVSVLIPTYNYARYLPEAVGSVLAQEFADWELIVADDNSGDDSRTVLTDLARRDPRIRVHVHPANLGMVPNWNWCLAQARGEFVKFLFGDDRLARPDALGKMAAMLDANPGAALAASARQIIDETARPLFVRNDLGTPGLHDAAMTIFRCLAGGNVIGEPSAVMFRRGHAARGFSTAYRQLVDLEMWLHLLGHGPLVFSEEPLCAFRRHPLQQTESHKRDQVDRAEYLRLVLEYGRAPAPAGHNLRGIEFARLYESRRFTAVPDVAAARAELMARHGQARYAARWLARKIANPFIELRKFCRRFAQG